MGHALLYDNGCVLRVWIVHFSLRVDTVAVSQCTCLYTYSWIWVFISEGVMINI